MALRRPFAFVTLLAAVGCGGAVSTTGALPDAGSSITPAAGAQCAASLPTALAACDAALVCEYANPTGRGTTIARCAAAVGLASPIWRVVDTTPPANELACPPRFDSIPKDALCPARVASTCRYPEGDCLCVCTEPGKSGWYCDARTSFPATTDGYSPSSETCPANRPLLGTACASSLERLTCVYSEPCAYVSFGPNMICKDGAWDEASVTAACGARPTCDLPVAD